MNITEFSLEFDILYNNIMSGTAPGLNEYEKSVFLTMAQEQVLKNYFSPKSNSKQEGIGDSIKRDLDFSNLIKTTQKGRIDRHWSTQFYKNTVSFNKPGDLFLPLEFKLRTFSNDNLPDYVQDLGVELTVVPLKDEEIRRIFSKPYKEPFKGTAFKIDNSTDKTSYDIIVGKKHKGEYLDLLIRYVRIPNPIILTNLTTLATKLGITGFNLSIRGETNVSECELAPSLHPEVLRVAVNLAKIHYEGSPEMIVQYSSLAE